MKKILILFILLSSPLYSRSSHIGEITFSRGSFSNTNISCSGAGCNNRRKIIFPGDRIRTNEKSEVHIRLKDGTAVRAEGPSDFIIYSIRMSEDDKPARIYCEYGLIKIFQQNNYIDSSLTVETRNAVIKSVCSVIFIATAEKETDIMVYRGKAGIASSMPALTEAYIAVQGDRISVKRGKSPEKPVTIKPAYRKSWLSDYILSSDRKHLLRYRRGKGLLDWLFYSNGK